MKKSKKLFEPVCIGTMEIPNRIVMPPMGTNMANPDGTVSERIRNYYAERAKGGVGLIIVEIACIYPGGKGIPNQLCIDRDEVISGLRSLVDAVHQYSAKIAIQLHHAGRQTESAIAGAQPVAPSAIRGVVKEEPRELTIVEIKRLVEAYAEGARRAREAGADAVEIHGAHGYLIHQFLSPYSNKRTDEYGGDLERRMRFALEIVELCRKKLGGEFPLLFRISGDEYIPGGLTLRETRIISRKLEEVGVDCLHVSAGAYESMYRFVLPASALPGSIVYLAEEIKKAVGIPVIAVGKINTPEFGEKILSQKKADLVSIGRALMADPEFARKAKEGRAEDIRPCIACMNCFDSLTAAAGPIICTVNASLGKEGEYVLNPVERPKRIMVVGGGPAGMECARVAAMRGHRVVLYEKEMELGGQMVLAAKPPYKEEIGRFIEYLGWQLNKLGVDLKLRVKVNKRLVMKEGPEVVVVATGSEALVPEIAGVDAGGVLTAREVVSGKKKVKKEVVIVGGGQVGLETAEMLMNKAKKVTVVEMLARMGVDMGVHSRRLLLGRLQDKVALETKAKVVQIQEGGVMVEREDERGFIKAGSVILAVGIKRMMELAEELKGEVKELYSIGDCAGGGKIVDAIADGYRVGMQI
ncbi:MAG TPA: FAD-dependent oxidoreductase [Dehalococcoidia bacterium]|nr:FAD-dependent oxidoreductase [Dehalococcoidia bacterium]